MRFDRRVLALVAVAVFTSIVFASVFVYYPAWVTVSPVQPPVYFATGSNANQQDLGPNNTIGVSLGPNSASLAITIHPTYQVSYYKDIVRIVNGDSSKVYYAYLRVYTAATGLPDGSQLVLYVYSKGASRSLSGYQPPTPVSGTYLASLDLITATSQKFPITISAGSPVEIDLYVYIPEGSTPPASVTAKLLLVYTTSSTETPP
ncbi:hypothetical protein WLZ34_05770 [Thermogladius sp. KZ2Tp1]|uniref:hypothetical protein n=1 Tax=Thermogladius sp. KZ2Tp1 TaxID=3136289 RepID=UPI003DA8C37B